MHANDESAASGQPILRYELVPLPQGVRGIFTKAPPTPPPLVLDMGIKDAIRVIDPKTNAVVASASVAQVTATPARHRSGGDDDPWHTDPPF
jgi:hypothetical protein